MARDTYRDHVTRQEMVEAGPLEAGSLRFFRIGDLLARSGANNVANAALHQRFEGDALHMAVTFSSSAWTGR